MISYDYFSEENITETEPLDSYLGNIEALDGSSDEKLESVQSPDSSLAIQAKFLESKKIKDFGK